MPRASPAPAPIGAVKAIAQTSEGVTFIGGFGDDEFTGGDGYDTLAGGDYGNDLLDGGAGTDRAVFAGAWSDYDIQVADGVVTLTSLLDGTVDTVRGVELFKFANGTVSLANLGTGEVNEPPSVSLENVLASLAENASTVSRIKVADIVITDDAIDGNRQLSLTGRDAMLFEIVGMALFLKAGVLLDATTMTDLQVAVAVDDDGIDGAPDGVSPTLDAGDRGRPQLHRRPRHGGERDRQRHRRRRLHRRPGRRRQPARRGGQRHLRRRQRRATRWSRAATKAPTRCAARSPTRWRPTSRT